MQDEPRQYRAGSHLEDLCRACKIERRHTVVVADAAGRPLRVLCDHCGSQHNYRGGARKAAIAVTGKAPRATHEPFDPVSPRERSAAPMSHPDASDLEQTLRRIIREEAGLTPAIPAEKWRNGDLVLRPGRAGVQEKSWPIETFFHKIVMLRNRLRVLEQHINSADLPPELKLKLQGYITACYGSLTSFNVLFAEESDRFRGSGGGD